MKPSILRMFSRGLRPGLVTAICLTGPAAFSADVDHVLSSTSGTWAAATWTNGTPSVNPGDIATYSGGSNSTVSLGSAVTIGVLRGAMSNTSTWGISSSGSIAFTMDGTGISAANNRFSNAGTASIVNSSPGGTLTVRPNLIMTNTNLDIGMTGSGAAAINIGAATANENTITNADSTARALNFRLNAGTGNMNIGSSIGVTGVTGGLINISNLGTNGTGAVVISGNLGTFVGSVVQNSTNSRLILSGANDYAGAYTITSGALSFATRTALYNANTTQWTPANIQVAAAGILGLGYGGTGSFSEAEIKAFNDGAFLTAGSRLGIEVASGNTGTYAEVIANANAGANVTGFVKLGAGTLILTGANTYTGNTLISGGTLRLSAAQGETSGPLGGGTASLPAGTIHFNGGTLQYSSANTTDYSSRFSTAAGNQVIIDTNGQTVTFASGINSSTGTLSKTGSGTLILTAASTMTNGSVVTNISAGTLRGVDSTAYTASSNTLQKIFGTGTVQVGNNATLDARADGLNDSSSQTLTYGNQVQVSSTGATYNINVDQASATGGTNKIIAFGSHNIGANTTMNLTGGNGYSLSLNQLQLGGGGTANSVMTMNPTTANLLLNGVSGGSQTASPTLRLSGTSSGNVISGTVANPNATVTNRTSIIKSGTSIWTLGGTNTYTGTTTIEAGTLVVNGSIAASTATVPTTIVQAAGTLAGTGTINNALAISGTVAPGALNGAAGKMTFNSSVVSTADFSTGGNLQWSITALTDLESAAGTDYDELTLAGAMGLTLGGTSSLTLSFSGGAADPNSADAFWTTARSWKIVNSTGTGTNSGATNFSQITNADYTTGSFTTLADASGNVFLNFTPIPEPGTATLLAAALGLSLRRRRNA
ncbi:autotransporter-associated beta strand repeat-containing protein [Luteolibacter sp. SL250]|uniref:beta strand repeat-containing protein n=1 Tax=Luteolibacter sp. SL250 TaxID=2995170 RepID=UPI00226EE3A7|nr:autotransporter-associated beta strand repeat-containing protein [Luteolibacter sp. SL250]WAC19477.1 autotransporter-associated beta strand repeat-containing protein [Luteolibacter sp. SL250]